MTVGRTQGETEGPDANDRFGESPDAAYGQREGQADDETEPALG